MAKKKSKKRRARSFRRFLRTLVVFALIAVFIRIFLFETVIVTSDAMSPAYQPKDVVSMLKHEIIFKSSVQRDDVVLARFESAGTKLLRRVAGIPGDRIEVEENGRTFLVYENAGTSVREELVNAPALENGTLPEGAYLLLNDNADAQADDSRTLGLVYITDITAKAGKVIWPPSRMFRS